MSKVLYEKPGEIARITLNRPDKRNAIDAEVDAQLRTAWVRILDDNEVRLAVVSGNGERQREFLERRDADRPTASASNG